MERGLSPDLEYEGTDEEEDQNPANSDQEASVDQRPVQSPAAGEDSSQSLAREGLWQDVADVPGDVAGQHLNLQFPANT